jgi:aminopeptidase-like protein
MSLNASLVCLNHMHAGLVLPCFGDQTALNSGYKKTEILSLKHILLVKVLICHFCRRDLTLKNKNHLNSDLNQTKFMLQLVHIFVYIC